MHSSTNDQQLIPFPSDKEFDIAIGSSLDINLRLNERPGENIPVWLLDKALWSTKGFWFSNTWIEEFRVHNFVKVVMVSGYFILLFNCVALVLNCVNWNFFLKIRIFTWFDLSWSLYSISVQSYFVLAKDSTI